MSTPERFTSSSRVAIITPPSDLNYASRITPVLETHPAITTIELYDPTTDVRLPSTGQFDLVIVTGSTARVHHTEPWITDLATHLRDLADGGTPVLGVCFGHQLLASGLGGTVEPLQHRAAGYRSIETTDQGRTHPLFAGLGNRFTSFHWHRDHVTELPADAIPLARNDTALQAFACETRPVAGIQFHPEVGLPGARTLAATRPRRTLPHDIGATITDAAASRAARTRRIYENAVYRLNRSNPDD